MISRHVLAKRKVRQMIQEIYARSEMRLPTEPEIAAHIGISRETVRSALLSLQKEGIVARRHGRGTFLNYGVVEQPANMGEGKPFLSVIQDSGYAAEATILHHLRFRTSEPNASPAWIRTLFDEHVKGRLVSKGDDYLVIVRMFQADTVPVILAVDFLSRDSLLESTNSSDQFGDSIYEFVQTHTEEPIAYSVAELAASRPDPQVAEYLEISPQYPLLLLLHLHYWEQSRTPIAVTCAFVNSDRIRFSVFRSGYEL